MIRVAAALLLALLLPPAARAQDAPADSTVADSTAIAHNPPPIEDGFHLMPPRFRTGRVVGVPKVTYSSERGVGAGAELRFYLGDRHDPGSRLDLEGRYTSKGQILTEMVLTTDIAGGKYSIKTKFGYEDLSLRYYGLGPGTPVENKEIYRPESLLAYIEAFRRMSEAIKLGIRYEYENTIIKEYEKGGLLDTAPPRGIKGGSVLGLGLSGEFDTRDDQEFPTGGSYIQGFAMAFDDGIGSEYDFNVWNLDVREYFSVSPKYVLATQFFIYAAKGGPPFWRLAALGGREHTRGYRRGRNLDNVLYAFQAELRLAVYRRFGVVGFAGLGDVAHTTSQMELEHMKPTLGGGLRYRTGARNLRARLDLAFGNDLRVYLGLGEAF